jgi:hypothetical protein
MNNKKALRQMIGVVFVTALLTACVVPPPPTPAAATPTSTKATEQIGYNDPFAYCAAVGTVDTPDERYIGPKMPDVIVQGLIQQGIVSADAPRDFIENAVWRCMDGKVLVCHFGANLPCQEKADTGQVPTAGMEEFCQANPTADDIPAAVTGRATVYQWACKDGKPEVVKTLFKPDERGYLSDFWYELKPN